MTSPCYKFGPYEVRIRTREIYKYGTRLKLRPQPFQVLQVLVEHAGDVVTRDELRQILWPAETFVDFEHGLNTSIKELRRILSDSATQPRYIETIPKLGYRIVAPVEAEPALHVPSNGKVKLAPEVLPHSHRSRRWWLYSAGILLSAALAISINRRPELESSMPVPLTSFPGNENEASWSPDGRQVAFMWNGEKQDHFDIYLLQPGSSQTLRLTADGGSNYSPAWSPDGRWIAYIHRDSRRSSLNLISPLGGAVRTVLTGDSVMGRMSWLPGGRALVLEIISAPRQPAALWLVWIETGKHRALTSPPAGIPGDTAPAVSPDGKMVAFCRASFWRTAELYLLDLKPDLSSAGLERRVTDLGFVGTPAWTPDGDRIVFGCSREGAGLCQVDRAGRRPQPVFGVPTTGSHPAFVRRPGGYTSLVFTSTTSESTLWRYSTEQGPGGSPMELARSTRSQGCPRYSADGKKLAFAGDRSGYQEIWTADADGSQSVQLTDLRHLLTEAPDWSPSGEEIAFVSQDRANRQICIVRASGGPAVAITSEEGIRSGNGWSHDGSAYYYTSIRTGRPEVWRVPRTGGRTQQITTSGATCGFESARGTFYYWKGENWHRGVLLRRTPQGDQPVPLAPQGLACLIAPALNGFYFESADTHDIYLYDEAADRSVHVLPHPDRVFGRFTVSPDGRWLALDSDGAESSDLMIMEHFR
jgi:Tol biopolymer transport system component/DNA-binding winged helix-turn-helix (wHTH) protein